MRVVYPLVFFFVLVFSACNRDYSPKPRGYFRIDFPEKKYVQYESSCPYTFEYPVYAKVVPDSARDAQPCWADVAYPSFNGKIHLSYQSITSKKIFNELIEDSRAFAFKHTVKATAIDEGIISYPDRKVYGIYYTIDGNTASSVQFFLTDSTKNYVRGALYFDEKPQIDSIRPVLDFIKKDIDVMIKSFKWKGTSGGNSEALKGRKIDKQTQAVKKNVSGVKITKTGEGLTGKLDSGILFDVNKSDLKDIGRTTIQSLLASMKNNPDTDIMIIGHTDASGTSAYNQSLSERRAQSVKDYAVQSGLISSRVTTLGKGASEPIADNTSSAGMAQNRRVEIVIVSNDKMKSDQKVASAK